MAQLIGVVAPPKKRRKPVPGLRRLMPSAGSGGSSGHRRHGGGGSAPPSPGISDFPSVGGGGGRSTSTGGAPSVTIPASAGGGGTGGAYIPPAVSSQVSPTTSAIAAATKAFQRQQDLLQKYVLEQTKDDLINQQVQFNKKGEAVGFKETPRQIGEDLHTAAERIRQADYHAAGLSQNAKDYIQTQNAQGKTVGVKKLGKMSYGIPGVTKAPKLPGQAQASAAGPSTPGYKPPQTLLGGAATRSGSLGGPIRRKNVATSKGYPGLYGRYPSNLEFGLMLASAPFPEVGAAVKGIEAGTEAVRATSAIGKGAQAVKAGGAALRTRLPSVLQKGETSIAARAISGTAEKVAPKAAARLGAAGTKIGETVPGASRFGRALATKPLRTGSKTLFAGATGAAIAQHPQEQAGQLTAAVGALSHLDSRDISKAGGTAAQVVTHLPTAVEYTARSLTDPTVRAQTLYGLKSLGFSAIEFPVLAPYEIATKGLGPAASEFVGGYSKDISRRWSPVLQGNYDEFLKQAQKEGAGGVAYTITELLPLIHGTSVAAKAAVKTGARAGELAHLPGSSIVRDFLDKERPNLRRGAGAEQVRPQELSKGLVGTASQRLADVVGRRLQLRAETKAGTPYRVGKKAGAVRPRPAMSLAEGERAPVSQFLPGAKKVAGYARRRGPARVVSGAKNIRAMQGFEITKPMQKIERRYSDHQELLAYAIEHGAPKDAEAMVKTLEAKRATLPPDAPEIGQIDKAIADIQKNPKLVNDRFRRDVQRMQELQQTAEGRTSLLAPEQANTRRLAEAAEQLARRPGTKLPPLEDVLGPAPGAVLRDAKAQLAEAEKRAKASATAHARHSIHAKAFRTSLNEKAMSARERRDALDRRAKTDRAKVREAKAAVKDAQGQLDSGRTNLNVRNWADDGRRYVQAVGESRIQAESERVGMGRPGYFPSRKRPGSENIVPQEARSKGLISFQRSKGELARSGGRQMSAFLAHQETGRLLDTEMRRAIIQRMEKGYGLSLDQLRKGRDTTFKAIPERKLKGWQRVQELRDSGYDPSEFVAMNTKTWEKRVQQSLEKAANEGKASEGAYADAYSQALADASKIASEITPADKGFDGEVSFVPRDEHQQAMELAGLGPQVQKAFIWNRIKTLGTRFVLANPGWFAFQMYAATFLAGVGKPTALLPHRLAEARKFVKDAPAVERDNFEAVMGLPMGGSADWNYRAGSLLAGTKMLNRFKSTDTWVKHFENRNPLDVFFSGIPRFERPIRRSMLHSEVKREAWKRMGGNVRKIGAIFDQMGKFSKEKNPTLAELDRTMHEIAADRPTMERLAKHTLEWLGDYETYSVFERNHLQQNLMFYGFLRHSLMLTAWTLPVKHPLRLALFAKASQFVDAEQKKTITKASRAYFAQFLIDHYGVSEQKAAQAARKLMPKVKEVPIEMMGRVMFPNGQIIDTVRASPLGNTILQAESPTELVSLLNPAMAIPLSSAFGIQPFTGAPIQKTATSAGPSLDPRILIAQGLGYISPLRLLSQAVSKYPSSERTAYSFPLPGGDKLPNIYGLDMFRETPQQYSGSLSNMEYQRQLFRRGVQVSTRGGWRTVEQTLAPFAPHPTALLPAYVLGQFDPSYGGLHTKAVNLRAKEADRAAKKADKGGGGVFSGGGVFAHPSGTFSGDSIFGGGGTKDDNAPTLTETGGRGYYNTIRQDLVTLLGKKFFEGASGAAAPFVDTFKRITTPQASAQKGGGLFASAVRTPKRTAAFPQREKEPKGKPTQSLAKITGPLSSDEKVFASTLAKQTGLSPKVTAAWTLAEGGNASGDHNYLNVGVTDSGPLPLTAAAGWSDPASAANLTAQFIKGKWGGASSGIQGIASAVGKPDATQLQTIAGSGWATNPAYASLLSGTYQEVGVSGKTKVKGGRPLSTAELFYDPGINLKDGQPTTPVGGHETHVHFASTKPRSILRAARVAERHGLNVSENPAFGGVEPVHTSTSYHYRSEPIPSKLLHSKLYRKSGATGKTIGEAIDINAGTPQQYSAVDKRLAALTGASTATSTGTYTTPTGTTGAAAPTSPYAASPISGVVSTAKTSVTHSDELSATQKLRLIKVLNQPGGALKLLGIPGAFTQRGNLTTDGAKMLAQLSADRLRLLSS